MANEVVQIPCKTQRKFQCNSRVKKCIQRTNNHISCVKNILFTDFSHSSHRLYHNPTTSIFQLFFPLFHRPYNYNYYIFK